MRVQRENLDQLTWQISGLGLDADAALDDSLVEGALPSRFVAVRTTSVRRQWIQVATLTRLPWFRRLANKPQ